MKIRVFFYSAAILMAIFLVSQSPSYCQFRTDSSINYFTITEYYDAYFDSLIQIKGSENMQGTGYKDYLRWKWFYSDRHGAGGDLGAIWGGISDYYEYYQLPENYSDLSDWRFVGPLGIPLKPNNTNSNNTGKGMMLSLWVDEGDHDLIFAGSHHSGLWKTVDGGDNWFPLHDSDPAIHGVNSIAVDPADHDIIYITALNSLAEVSSYSSGLFKSRDGGVSWTGIDFSGLEINYPNAYYGHEARKVILHPNDPDIVYFINMQNVLRSYDHGQTWQKIFSKKYFPWGGDDDTTNFDYHNGLYDLKVAPWNDSLLFLAGSEIFILQQNSGTIDTINISNSIFLAGLDQDDTLRYPPSRSGISVHENYPGKFWICHSGIYSLNGNPDTNYFRIVSYDLSSMSATLVFQHKDMHWSDPGISKFKLVFNISPSDDSVFYLGGTYLFKLDLNQSQNPFHNLAYGTYPDPCWMHVDMRDMLMFSDGLGHDTLYLANDAGISWGTDFEPPQQCNANSWYWRHICSSMENGLNVTEFYGLGISDTDPYIFAGGCQDLSDMMLNQDGWVNFGEGDGSEVVFDPVSPEILYFYEWGSGGTYYRSNDIETSSSIFYQGGSSYVMTPMVLDPINPSIMYSGNRSLLKFTGVNDFENPGLITPDTMANFNYGLTDIEVVENQQNSKLFYVSTNKAYHSWESSLPDPEGFDSCIFKSVGGAIFTDITSGLAGCRDGHITDIEANPDNPAQLWVAFGKFSKGSQDGKVFTSTDSGTHWSDCFDGLPEGLPVYKVEYLAGSERLFACTDVGVFKKDTGDTQWYPFSNNLPLKIYTDLEVNEPFNKLVVSSFGRGIWETALDCPPNKYVQVITEDTLWNQDMVLDHEVAVDSNATLTIQNCRVALPSDAKIVVRRGGYLVLDSAHLTTNCLEPWAGIELWGDDDFSQFQAQHFGRVDIKNNSIVENAVTAILTGRSDLGIPTNEFNGGIFSIKEATFRNNQTAIEVLPYRNFHPVYGYEMPYFGKMANAVLITDQARFQDYPFKQFIKLTQVNGIDIKGCDFSNELPKTVAYPDRGKGIYSLSAQFYIDDYCLNPQIQPCQEWKHSTFYGLEYGIRSLSDGSRRSCSVKNAVFDHNRRGIYLNAIDLATLLNNSFDILSLTETMGDTLCGIYLDHCTAYQVENNDFQSNSAPNGVGYVTKIGLVVNNSGVSYNEIYNNIFDSLKVGVLAIDTNRDENGIGLQILCNDFTVCRYDIAVMKSDQWARDIGIARDQGSNGSELTSPANNTFSWISIPESDYYNECEDIIYWHLKDTITAHTKPRYYSILQIIPLANENVATDYVKSLNCPQTGDTIIGGDRITYEVSKMLISESSADSVQNLLNILIDGGSTNEMNSSILNSSPEDSLLLRQDLIGNSPYLSETVILSSIEKEEVLSSSVLTEILSANPHSAKSDTIQDALDYRYPELSEEQRILIDQGWFTAGNKESLESELNQYKSMRSRSLNNIIRAYKFDTLTVNATDSIIGWLANEMTLQDRYHLINECLSKKDTTTSEIILGEIPVNYTLTGQQTVYYQSFEEYYAWRVLNIIQDKSIFQLDSSDLGQLQSMYTNSTSLLREYIQNVLDYLESADSEELFILPNGSLKSNVKFPNRSAEILEKNQLQLYPNPASDFLTVHYKSKRTDQELYFFFIDISGRIIMNTKLSPYKEFYVIATKNLLPGVYLCCIYSENRIVDQQKLIILR